LDSDDIDPDLETTIPVFPIQPQINLDSQSENVNEENISLDLAVKIITKLLGRFCSQLLATGVNNSTVDLVIKELEYSMSEIFNLITMLSKQFCSRNNEEFSCKIKSLLSGFKNVRSTYHRQKYFEQNENFIHPVEKSLGTRTEVRVQNFKRQQVVVSDTFMYVPLLDTLKKIISVPELAEYFTPEKCTVSQNSYECFHDSYSFKNNQLFSRYPNSIQIQLFYDDFETVNPLGSKRGVHKLGGLYFTLRNFPDFLNSRLIKFIY
jgi:hypothetical protein